MADRQEVALARLIEATEKKAQAELLRRQAEEQRAVEERKAREANERRIAALEELTQEVRATMDLVRALLDLIRTKFDPQLDQHSSMLQLLLEVQRLVIPRLIEEGQGQDEIERLTKMLLEIGRREKSQFTVTTGDVGAERDVVITGG